LKGLPSKRASSPPSIEASSLSDDIQYSTYQPQHGAYLETVHNRRKWKLYLGRRSRNVVKFEIALAKPQNFQN
jgi:hypothetical protein